MVVLKRLPFLFLLLFFFFRTLVIQCSESGELERIYGILVQNPKNVNAWNAYGIELAKLGNLTGAIGAWRSGLELDRRYVHFYNNIGSALRRLGYFAEALEWYLASLKLQPTYWTWYNLGLLYEDIKKPQEAICAYAAAVELCKNFTLAEERMFRLKQILQNRQISRIPPPEEKFPPLVRSEASSSHAQSFGNVPKESLSPVPVAKPPTDISVLKPENTTSIPPRKKTEIRKSAVLEAIPETVPPKPLPSGDGAPVFFTFDGGADADGIPGILEALRERGIKSTFFLTGKWVENYSDLAIQILAAGHEIANHSMGHHNMSNWGAEEIKKELEKAEEAFNRVLGRPPIKYFRFPFGAQNPRVEKIVTDLGYHTVYWDIDTLDWKEPSVSSIVSRVRSKLKPRSVILMHCGSKNGAKALPQLLDEVLKRGFRPIPLSSLDPQQIAAIYKE